MYLAIFVFKRRDVLRKFFENFDMLRLKFIIGSVKHVKQSKDVLNALNILQSFLKSFNTNYRIF